MAQIMQPKRTDCCPLDDGFEAPTKRHGGRYAAFFACEDQVEVS